MKDGLSFGVLPLFVSLTVLLTFKVSSAADDDRFKGGSYDGYQQVTTDAVVVKIARGTMISFQ